MHTINTWFTVHHRLTLTLMWIFTAIAVGIGSYLALFRTEMDYFRFLACLALPVILAVYFRLIYGKYEQQRRETATNLKK